MPQVRLRVERQLAVSTYPHSCPQCAESFVGEEIPRQYVAEGLYPEKCDGCAENSHWANVMGVYSLEQDRTVGWKCPFCDHEWEREG